MMANYVESSGNKFSEGEMELRQGARIVIERNGDSAVVREEFHNSRHGPQESSFERDEWPELLQYLKDCLDGEGDEMFATTSEGDEPSGLQGARIGQP